MKHRSIPKYRMDKKPDPVEITYKNIQAIYDHEQAEMAKDSLVTRITNAVAIWSGTVNFIVIHVVTFVVWVCINLTPLAFDPYPFGLLTMWVSLESILLSAFLLFNQSKMGVEADRRHKLDLQINLLAEQESTAQLRLMMKIAEKLGIDKEHLKEAEGLSDDTNPTDVLEQIVHVEKQDEKK